MKKKIYDLCGRYVVIRGIVCKHGKQKQLKCVLTYILSRYFQVYVDLNKLP